MLAAQEVAKQLPAVVRGLKERLRKMAAGMAQARQVLARWSEDPAAGDEAVDRAMSGSPRPFALSLGEAPASLHPPPALGAVTVVSADGSTIPVDRFAPFPCYVVNTGSVALPYGLDGEPVLETAAAVGPADGGHDPDVSGGGLDLLRDVHELEAATRLAADRAGDGPVVALLDGTLLPWDLDSPQVDPAVRVALRDRTAAALGALRRLPGNVVVGAYVSASRSADVVTSLGQLGEPDDAWPTTDGLLFRELLPDGWRSAVFRARSERGKRVEEQFGVEDQVCFFYFRAGDDIARVELPLWATAAARLSLLHAVLVDQCRRCEGYPRALQEAHERAVVSGADRDLFSVLLEKEAIQAGVHERTAGKAASKRRRHV